MFPPSHDPATVDPSPVAQGADPAVPIQPGSPDPLLEKWLAQYPSTDANNPGVSEHRTGY